MLAGGSCQMRFSPSRIVFDVGPFFMNAMIFSLLTNGTAAFKVAMPVTYP